MIFHSYTALKYFEVAMQNMHTVLVICSLMITTIWNVTHYFQYSGPDPAVIYIQSSSLYQIYAGG